MDALQLWTAASCIAPLVEGAALREAKLGAGWLRLCFGTRTSLVIAQQRAPLGLWLADPCPQSRVEHPVALGQLLRGFLLQRIDVPWGDRILRLSWERVTITKERQHRHLIAECFGGRGNLAVTDADDSILWAWRWDRLDSREMRFLPGHRYAPPARGRAATRPFADTLSEPLQLLGPRARSEAEDGCLEPARLDQALVDRWAKPSGDWYQWRSQDGSRIRYPLRLRGSATTIPALQALRLEAPPWEQDAENRPDPNALQRQRLDRLKQRMARVREDLIRWQRVPDTVQRDAEALFQMPDAVHPGGALEVPDYRSDGIGRRTVSVPAGYRLHDYARHLIKQRQRAQRGREACSERLRQLEEEHARLLQASLTDVPATPEKPGRRRQPQGLAPAIESREIDGFQILWGRNAKANDHLTFRLAQPWDLWFHVQDQPGSHVLLRRPRDRPVPEKVLDAAAQLALQFSSVQTKSADVDWTEARHIKRHPNGAPGRVLYRHFHTRRVRRVGS